MVTIHGTDTLELCAVLGNEWTRGRYRIRCEDVTKMAYIVQKYFMTMEGAVSGSFHLWLLVFICARPSGSTTRPCVE
jgi:hypothetical protein